MHWRKEIRQNKLVSLLEFWGDWQLLGTHARRNIGVWMLWRELMWEIRRQSLSSGVQECPEFQGRGGLVGRSSHFLDQSLFALNIKARIQTKQKSPDQYCVPMIILLSEHCSVLSPGGSLSMANSAFITHGANTRKSAPFAANVRLLWRLLHPMLSPQKNLRYISADFIKTCVHVFTGMSVRRCT